MLHKADLSEGCWNVPRQGQEPGRGVHVANNAKNVQLFVNKDKEAACQLRGRQSMHARVYVCVCVCVHVRELACVDNGNLEMHVQVVI